MAAPSPHLLQCEEAWWLADCRERSRVRDHFEFEYLSEGDESGDESGDASDDGDVDDEGGSSEDDDE